MNSDVNPARSTFNRFDRLNMWIELLPLAGPVGTNLFFANRASAFRGLGPAHVLTHERQGGINVSPVESRVGLSDRNLCICHGSSPSYMCVHYTNRHGSYEKL